MTTDIKQAVRELREALAAVAAEPDAQTAAALEGHLGIVASGRLPAVLDRLEELEASADWKAAWYALDEDARKLRAERDAIRAKFAEFRAAVDQWVGMGSEADEDDVSALQRRYTDRGEP